MLVAAIQKATLFLFASWRSASPTMLWGFDKLEQQLEELVEEIDNLLLETDMLIDDIHEARKAAEKLQVR